MRAFFLSLIIVLFSVNASPGQSSLNFTSEDHTYRTGLQLLNEGKYLAASKQFESYLERGKDPIKLADAEYFVAFSTLQLRNKDGEALIEKFISDHPMHTKSSLAYYELGNLKYNERNYKAAIGYFEKLYFPKLNKDVQYDAKFKLGYSYFTQKKFDRAYEMFNDLKREEHKYQFPSSYYAGYINFEKGEYDRAFYDFTRAEKNAAYAPVIPSMLVKVYYKQKRYDELLPYALASLDRKDVRDKSEINLYIGETYFQKKDYDHATRYYDAYLKNKKGNVDRNLLFRIAYVQMHSGKSTEAIDSFKKVALKSDTLGFIASYYLGNLYVKTENKNYALSAYKVAKDNKYDETLEEEALFQYARLNLDVENFDEAIKSINEYKRKYPGSERVENIDEILTEAYLNSRNYDKALKHIEEMSYRSPRINRAYQQIAFLKGTELFNNGKYYQAVQHFDKSLQHPLAENLVIKANYWKGESYSVGLKYEEAVKAYAGVFRADERKASPEYLESRYGIGYAYYNLKEYQKALDHFKYYADHASLSENKVKYRDALTRLGDCYYATKGYQLSLSTFDQVIEINRRLADYSYFRKGVVYGIMNHIEAANRSFDVVLKNYPESRHIANTLYQKGQFNFENGSYTYAIDVFTRLIKEYPESNYAPYALQSRAIAFTNINRHHGAEADYKTILGKYPRHEVANNALLGLQEVLQQTGNTGEFDKYLTIYRNANPESDQLERIEFEAAKSQYFNQQYDRAIRSLEQFLSSYPNSAQMTEARYLIADAFYRIGNYQPALEHYYSISNEISFNRYNRVIQRIAELEYTSGNYGRSIEYFTRLGKIAASKKEEFTAWKGLMNSYYHTGEYEQAIAYGDQILEKGQVASNAKNEALLLLGKASLAIGKGSEGRDYLEQTVVSAKDENGAEALYLIAEILHESELYKESIDRLFELNSNFSIYEYWLGKSFILIADNYLAMGEDFQAKATLQSVIDNSPVE
ncbi:MAG: tetratricopeptide repeat protein [Cytophagales bacterium]|nr:tetratricopeptide repeat protein [Cytophagales bacterium]